MWAIGEAATPRTTVETFLSRAASLGERPFLHYHHDGRWQCLTWAEARQRVLRVAAALVAEGVRPGDRVVVISENRYEWILADFGIQAAAAVTVPVFPSLLPRTVRAIVEDSGAVVGLAGTDELACKLLGPRAMRRAVTFEPDLHRWLQREPLEAEVRELERRAARMDGDDVATIVYTSGTTGESKGVLLAHRNVVDMAASDLRAFRIGPEDVLLSVLPYAHVLERLSATKEAREPLVPLASAAARLSAALAAVAAAAAAATLFVPGVLRGPAVMNGSGRGTALVALFVAVPAL